MKRWTSALFASLILMAPVGAEEWSCLGAFSGSVEALYWKPSFGGFDYAGALVEGNTRVDIFTLKSRYDWGVWAGVRYLTPSECSFAQLSGHWTGFEDSARVVGSGLFDTFGQLEGGTEVRAHSKIDYWWLDLRWAQYLARGCGIEFYAFGGVRYADLATRLRVESEGGSGTGTTGGRGRTKSELQGVGPEVGIGGEYCVFGDLTLFGHLDLAALASKRIYRQDTFNTDIGSLSRLRYPRLWGVVPALDAKLGIAYTYRCGGWYVRGQVGYELNYYWNVNRVRIAFTGQSGGLNESFERTDRDLGFGGGFFGLTVGF